MEFLYVTPESKNKYKVNKSPSILEEIQKDI